MLDGFRLAYKLPPMESSTVFDQPAAKLDEIKAKIGRGDYRLDEHAVAESILRRWRERGPSAVWVSSRWTSRIDSGTAA